MKKHGYRLVWLLIVLGFWGTAIFLVFAPDTIAAHFNAAGEADRYGSKYEALLLPAVSALMGGIFLLCARTAGKKGAALYERIFLWTALGEVVLFHGIGAYAMWKMAGGGAGGGPGPTVDFMQLSSVLVGLLLVGLGNLMPKARRNTLFGVRTAWSMSGGEVRRLRVSGRRPVAGRPRRVPGGVGEPDRSDACTAGLGARLRRGVLPLL